MHYVVSSTLRVSDGAEQTCDTDLISIFFNKSVELDTFVLFYRSFSMESEKRATSKNVEWLN